MIYYCVLLRCQLSRGRILNLFSSQVILNAVRDSGPSPLPSTCLYKIFNENVGTCCASVSKDAQVLATGNEDSSVEVWDLLPSKEHLNGNFEIL